MLVYIAFHNREVIYSNRWNSVHEVPEGWYVCGIEKGVYLNWYKMVRQGNQVIPASTSPDMVPAIYRTKALLLI